MRPREYLDLADELATGAREAEWRSAASRAYYAAFHTGRSLLRKNGFSPPGEAKDHAYVWLRLSNTGHVDVDLAGSRLHDLRRVRGRADYDFDRPFSDKDAVKAVEDALNVIRALDDLAATPTVLARVVDALRAYERDVLQDVTWRQPPP